MATPPYDARAVANFFLDRADNKGVNITQLILLKLVYFAHGWYLASNNKPLIIQDFEAWKHGPVVKVVRDSFRSFGKQRITTRAEKLDIFTGQYHRVVQNFSNYDTDFMCSIFDEYSGFGAWELSELTHEAGSPWDMIWNSKEPIGRFALRITNKEIQTHFLTLSRRTTVS